jgi:hypothetical protein
MRGIERDAVRTELYAHWLRDIQKKRDERIEEKHGKP